VPPTTIRCDRRQGTRARDVAISLRRHHARVVRNASGGGSRRASRCRQARAPNARLYNRRAAEFDDHALLPQRQRETNAAASGRSATLCAVAGNSPRDQPVLGRGRSRRGGVKAASPSRSASSSCGRAGRGSPAALLRRGVNQDRGRHLSGGKSTGIVQSTVADTSQVAKVIDTVPTLLCARKARGHGVRALPPRTIRATVK